MHGADRLHNSREGERVRAQNNFARLLCNFPGGERAKGELVWKEKQTQEMDNDGETGLGANWEEKILCQT